MNSLFRHRTGKALPKPGIGSNQAMAYKTICWIMLVFILAVTLILNVLVIVGLGLGGDAFQAIANVELNGWLSIALLDVGWAVFCIRWIRSGTNPFSEVLKQIQKKVDVRMMWKKEEETNTTTWKSYTRSIKD